MNTRLKTLIAGSVFAFIITGCVTINVYFPAAAAEKAADKLIEEIWQLKKMQNPNANQESSTTIKK